jgi:arylsulfatase A-like enzyme
MKIIVRLFLALMFSGLLEAGSPNILWITSEDNASQWLGCYGNKVARTPQLDALAAKGVLFEKAFSNAAVCAVARSTILNGCYAPSQGTQHMRSRHAIPPQIKSYVSHLRAQGYYCTNNSKTDYNFKGDDQSIWDECSNKAHYKNRPAGKPFFAVFNILDTHESTIFSKPDKQVAAGAAANIQLPPYLPDLPELRQDFAKYYDNVARMDGKVGRLIEELKNLGLEEDTIVFYFSDHGGPTPRGKRYLEDTGVRIPMIVRIPGKWQQLSPFAPGSRVSELVAFVDLAPTVLSLCGMEKPSYMQGRAFLGSRRSEPQKDPTVFLYADRFDEIYGMRRGITDGRYKYIRYFTPYLPAAPYSSYQFGQAGWRAWQSAWQQGKLNGYHKDLWEVPQQCEHLYDTSQDPWEINNLAGQPAHAELLEKMRTGLKNKMAGAFDTSLVPEPMWDEVGDGKIIYDSVRSPSFDLAKILDLAFAASAGDVAALPQLTDALASDDPVRRYWGAQGCIVLGVRAKPAEASLLKLLDDVHAANRISAAHALYQMGNREKTVAVLTAVVTGDGDEFDKLLALNTISSLQLQSQIPDEWWQKAKSGKAGKAGEYVGRMFQKMKGEP